MSYNTAGLNVLINPFKQFHQHLGTSLSFQILSLPGSCCWTGIRTLFIFQLLTGVVFSEEGLRNRTKSGVFELACSNPVSHVTPMGKGGSWCTHTHRQIGKEAASSVINRLKPSYWPLKNKKHKLSHTHTYVHRSRKQKKKVKEVVFSSHGLKAHFQYIYYIHL